MKKSKRMAGQARMQIAAMPIRRRSDGSLEVLLVTSRTTQRWIVPKGWPMKGLRDPDAAAREAFEEAGVVGSIARKPIGRYHYWKRMADYFVLCNVKLYVLDVESQLPSWSEQTQRQSHWFSLDDAADLVDEPELRTLLRKLAKPKLTKPKTTEAEIGKPKVTKPKVSKPKTTKPKMTKPKMTKPESTKPKLETPKVVKAKVVKPKKGKAKTASDTPV